MSLAKINKNLIPPIVQLDSIVSFSIRFLNAVT
jgi:hypothetical protein